jgi:8-oxo-dGTP diphosphatase
MKNNPARLKARVAAGVAIFRDDQILLLHRSPLASNPGAWDLPAGQVEPGETLTKAARREVREETGFDVRIGSLFHAEVFRTLSKRGKIRPTVGVYFHCTAPGRKAPRLDTNEHTEYAWVRATELIEYPTAPYLARAVRAAFASRENGGKSPPGLVAKTLYPTLGHHTALPVPA